ncbi:MAG: hypothetical protein ACI4ET_04495 [Bilifractor sp.]
MAEKSGKQNGKRSNNSTSTRSHVHSEKSTGMRELRTEQGRAGEQDEIALAREKARRRQRRRELERRRRKRRRIIALVRVFLCLAVAVLALTGILAVVRKYKGDQKKAADEAAAAAQAAQTTDIYPASQVLHLSFPVLTLDKAVSSGQTGNSNVSDSGTSDGDGTSAGDGSSDGDSTASGDNASAENSTTEDGLTSDTGDTTAASSTVSGNNTASGTLTVTEFQNILQDLYNQNYVLVDVYSLAQSTTTGFEEGEVSVPKGKKPLVISETGVGYKSGYDGHADQMVEDGSGGITNTYTDAGGRLQTGDADVAACLDTFIEAHPDFSYKDARGVLGITGEQGMLGYALKESGKQVGKLSADAIKQASGEAVSSSSSSASGAGSVGQSLISTGNTDNSGASGNADTSENTGASGNTSTAGNSETTGSSTAASEVTTAQVEKNKETLTTLIGTLRNEGWHLASGTYADISYASDAKLVKTDADSWADEIGSLLGDTDILLLPHGGDIGSWSGYSGTDERYKYLEELGFRYYLTENDQVFSWVQIDTNYVRIGTHTISSKADYDQLMQLQ